jgi:Cyclin, N-terminal domain
MTSSIDQTIDTITALMRQETKYYKTSNYLARRPSKDALCKSPSIVDVQSFGQQEDSLLYWRQQMLDWACMVVDSFQMDRDLVAISFGYLDRFVAAEDLNDLVRDDFQLYSMTCLYLAIKLHEPYPRKLGLEALVDMSRGFYSAADIESTESDICKRLGWHLSPPTASEFAQLFSEVLLTSQPRCQRTCATLTELALADPWFLDYAASTVGLAALCHAARLEGVSVSWEALGDAVPLNEEFYAVYRQLERLYCQ